MTDLNRTLSDAYLIGNNKKGKEKIIMKILVEAKYEISEIEYCDGCDAVSSYTGTCHGTDQ